MKIYGFTSIFIFDTNSASTTYVLHTFYTPSDIGFLFVVVLIYSCLIIYH